MATQARKNFLLRGRNLEQNHGSGWGGHLPRPVGVEGERERDRLTDRERERERESSVHNNNNIRIMVAVAPGSRVCSSTD